MTGMFKLLVFAVAASFIFFTIFSFVTGLLLDSINSDVSGGLEPSFEFKDSNATDERLSFACFIQFSVAQLHFSFP